MGTSTGADMWFSNIVIGVTDLDAASETLRDLGLDVLDGGTHPQFGTANRVVPLGRSYLELLAVVDPAQAARTIFGRSLMRRVAAGDRLARWSVRTPALDRVASALELTPEDRSRVLPDGNTIAWRAAGLSLSLKRPWLPFFVEWSDSAFPGAMRARHRVEVGDITWLGLTPEDVGELERWLLGVDLPLRIGNGEPDLSGVGVAIGGDGAELAITLGPRALQWEVRSARGEG